MKGASGDFTTRATILPRVLVPRLVAQAADFSSTVGMGNELV